MKKGTKLGILFIALVLMCIATCACYFFGPLGTIIFNISPAGQEQQQLRDKLNAQCEDNSINESIRKVICLDAKKIGGTNGNDYGAPADDFLTVENDLHPSYTVVGNVHKLEIYHHNDNQCFGPCGGDGGHYETWILAEGSNYIGTLSLFTYWKTSSQVAWEEKGNQITFYLYDESDPIDNTVGFNILLKYNFGEKQLYKQTQPTIGTYRNVEGYADSVAVKNDTVVFTTKKGTTLEEIKFDGSKFQKLTKQHQISEILVLSDSLCSYQTCAE